MTLVQKESRINVWRSDQTIDTFDKRFIINSLLTETKYAEKEFIGFDYKAISRDEAENIADTVEQELIRLRSTTVPSSLIREMVNMVLLQKSGENPAYEFYRTAMSRVGIPNTDLHRLVWNKKDNFEKNENANMNTLIPERSHKKIADMSVKGACLYWLNGGIAKNHMEGNIHVHQLEYPNRPFCSDYDMRIVFLKGLYPDGTGLAASVAGPAKHAAVALAHAAKITAAGQCNCQGGQGLFNFNIFIAPYLKGLSEFEIDQLAQGFLYEMNQSYVSRGGQLVFSSIQLEAGIPKLWRDAPVVYNGKIHQGETYGDYEEEAMMFMDALLTNYIKGDKIGKMFFFPKPEIRLRKEYFQRKKYKDLIRKSVELSAKFGGSYFDNVIPDYRDSEGQDCYQCCAYHFSEEKETLIPKVYLEDGAHFSMGGHQVVTINLPRIGIEANGNEELAWEIMRDRMDLSSRFLRIKRDLVNDYAKGGNLSFLTQDFMGKPFVDLDSFALVIGFVGMNEFVQAMTGFQLHEDRSAHRLGVRALVELESIKDYLSKRDSIKYSIARTPAESTASRFPLLDMKKFGERAEKLVKGDKTNWKHLYNSKGKTGVPVYYTNGFMVNYRAPIPLHQKIKIEEMSFPILSGGNILHVFLGESNPEVGALMKITEKIANTNVGYWSYTGDLSVCNNCGKTYSGILDECINCRSTLIDYYSRITGYYQAVRAWNAGKVQELKDRYRVM